MRYDERFYDKNTTLTAAEEQELFRNIEKGDREAEEIVAICNQRLVCYIANRYSAYDEQQDLIGDGNEGLTIAIHKFDYRKGYKFSTYASWWIKQSIVRAIANRDSLIRLPVYMRDMRSDVLALIADYEERHHETPSAREISEALGIPLEKALQCLESMASPVSLDMYVSDDGTTLSEFVASNELTPQDECEARDSLYMLRHVLDTELTEREKVVIISRYGLDGKEPQKLTAIGEAIGLTRERVRQIEREALSKLRKSGILRDAA